MYKIKLKRTSKNEFDKIIEVDEEYKAIWKYSCYMKEKYYYGKLVNMVDGKEQDVASFCNSEFARSNGHDNN